MIKSPRIQPASGPGGDALTARERVVADCARLLGERLPSLWRALFARLDDALHDLADKSTNDLSYRVYFDAREILVKQRRRLQSDFLRRVEQGAGNLIGRDRGAEFRPAHGEGAGAESGFGDLALLAESELEEMLATENLVSKAESRYRSDLMEFDRRFAALMGWGEVGLAENPFGPSALCHAFHDTLAALPPFEPSVKLVVYKLFDRHVMDQLDDFYRSCLRQLEPASSAIAVPVSRPRPTSTPRPMQGIPGPRDRPRQSPDTLSMPFDALRALLARQRPSGASRTDSGQVQVATAELLALLDNLDVASAPAIGCPAPETFLRAQLSAALAGEDRPRYALAERDEDALDLVFLFFEHLLAGGAIPDPIKILIGRMQIPVAKMALLDKDFFSKDTHPARVLINNIGRAAIGWSESDGRGPDSLYGMIERVIERLVLDFDGDTKVFVRMNRYFGAFLAREDARAYGVAGDPHAGESRDGISIALRSAGVPILDADRTDLSVDADSAQERVAAAVADRLAPYTQIPGAVEVLLREGWSLVLLAIHHSRGTDSADWQAALELIDRLLWSVSAKRTAEERRQLLQRIPRLLETLRRQLAEAGCDPRLTARWLGELQTLHLDVLQGSARVAVLGGSGVETGHLVPIPVPCGCAIGDWIDWAREDVGHVRLKLAAWNAERDELLFFDRQGRCPTRFSARGLAEAIGAGRVAVLGNGETPLADQALQAMLTNLREASFDD
ncbi:DUF1631 family protein [Thiocapsa bogorovii]|uniref:DUF1631 family protein n=1 Tax=Thiocapsa bogorovii TaxID=521689 RepID=UPI001E40C4EB|nr:DUF1631 family protein [Thiocapsa bogorovii]UHD18221.1 DUF1631 domain-containing protein [Thiocapsa bogorovii]